MGRVVGQGERWESAELARHEMLVGIEPTHCPECGLPLPGPHRGTCSVSLMRGGPGFGLPESESPGRGRSEP